MTIKSKLLPTESILFVFHVNTALESHKLRVAFARDRMNRRKQLINMRLQSMKLDHYLSFDIHMKKLLSRIFEI